MSLMNTTKPTTPAIVGVAQVVQRPGDVDLADARGPIELMLDAARAAADDAGAPALLKRVGLVGVAGGWFRYRNPGQLIAERIGSPQAPTMLTSVSGTGPQDMVGAAAERIAAGQLDVALIVGGEARWSHQRTKRAGRTPTWISEPGEGEPEPMSGFADAMMQETNALGSPATAYALFEDSLRAAQGRSVDEHRDSIAALWSSFSEIAAGNEFAWDRQHHRPSEIRDPGPSNRMISFPYTKAMVANNTVDMATAIILCRPEVARALGIANDRLVFPLVVTSSHETWRIIERDRLNGCPALTEAARVAFAHTGLSPDEIDHIDLYACFPAIVQMSSSALGLTSRRPLTITGGLGFAGAPIGNAVGHSIAAMTERVRNGGIGLVHGNGGQATKHSFGIYSSAAPTTFARIDVQPGVEHRQRAVLNEDWTGTVTVEAATVVYGREGADHLVAAVLDATGARAWAHSTNPDLMTLTETDGIAGRIGERTIEGELTV